MSRVSSAGRVLPHEQLPAAPLHWLLPQAAASSLPQAGGRAAFPDGPYTLWPLPGTIATDALPEGSHDHVGCDPATFKVTTTGLRGLLGGLSTHTLKLSRAMARGGEEKTTGTTGMPVLHCAQVRDSLECDRGEVSQRGSGWMAGT